MVGVAKWLRRQVVALEIEGSNPFAHPMFYFRTMSPEDLARIYRWNIAKYSFCARSSADQSTGLRNRGSSVRIRPGVPITGSINSFVESVDRYYYRIRTSQKNVPVYLSGEFLQFSISIFLSFLLAPHQG